MSVFSITTKLSNLEDARDEVEREHEDLVTKIRTETKMSEEYIIAVRCGALGCYHDVLQFIRGTVKVANERNASHTTS